MSFKRSYKIEYYQVNSPVVITDAFLLIDETFSKYELDFKIKNISSKIIRNIKGFVLTNKSNHSTKFDISFKVPLTPGYEINANKRTPLQGNLNTFLILIDEIIYDDLQSEHLDIEMIDYTEDFISVYNKEKELLLDYYRSEIIHKSNKEFNFPTKIESLIKCFCGEINLIQNITCNKCGQDINQLLDFNFNIMTHDIEEKANDFVNYFNKSIIKLDVQESMIRSLLLEYNLENLTNTINENVIVFRKLHKLVKVKVLKILKISSFKTYEKNVELINEINQKVIDEKNEQLRIEKERLERIRQEELLILKSKIFKILKISFTMILVFFIIGCVYQYFPHKINYNLDGGEVEPLIDAYKNIDETYELPTPTKEGYTFLYWQDQNGNTVTSLDNSLSLSFTLTAIWEINQYSISFEENGGTLVSDIIQDYNSEFNQPLIEREGYTFVGWYSNSDLTEEYNFNNIPAEDITLYAKWFLNAHTVSFVLNGGDGPDSVFGDYGSDLTNILFTKEGYTFQGWYLDNEFNEEYYLTSIPDEDITLYANWSINQYTISFEENSGSEVQNIVNDYGVIINEPEITKEGYTFAGWYLDSEFNQLYIFSTMPAENITLYAQWTSTFSIYDRGIMEVYDSQPITLIANYIETRNGYNNYIFIDSELTTKYDSIYTPENNITLYIIYEPITYTISFEENGGTILDDLVQEYGSIIDEPIILKEGYTFSGWYVDSSFTNTFTFTTMPSENINLYAKWTINNYTITFNVNGGTYIEPLLLEYNSPLPTFDDSLRTDYYFINWYTDSSLSTPFNETTMPSENIELFARWESRGENMQKIFVEDPSDYDYSPHGDAYAYMFPREHWFYMEGTGHYEIYFYNNNNSIKLTGVFDDEGVKIEPDLYGNYLLEADKIYYIKLSWTYNVSWGYYKLKITYLGY